MTLDEANKIAKIIATADNGCRECVEDMCDQMSNAFPRFEWKLVRGCFEPVYISDEVVVNEQKDE